MNIKVDINNLLEDAQSIQLTDASYFISYPVFLRYFQSKVELTRDDILIGINFTYAWMPTILSIYPKYLDEAVEILNALKKQGKIPNPAELKTLKATFNNSLVGVSKLLHFIAPDTLPIWDSRVYRYLTKQTPHAYRLQNIDNLCQYYKFCNDLLEHSELKQIRYILNPQISSMTKVQSIELKTDELTDIRLLELIMFTRGNQSD